MRSLLVGLCIVAALVFCVPQLEALLIFDRTAVADGQWWRLLSSSFVHLSPSHLLLNLLAMMIVLAWAPRALLGEALLLFLLVSMASGLFIGAAMPDMPYFGGLSGVVTAMFVYANLLALHDRKYRWLHASIIGAVALKTSCELLFDASLLDSLTPQPFRPVPAVHALGIVGAFIVHGLRQLASRHRGASAIPFFSRNEAS